QEREIVRPCVSAANDKPVTTSQPSDHASSLRGRRAGEAETRLKIVLVGARHWIQRVDLVVVVRLEDALVQIDQAVDVVTRQLVSKSEVERERSEAPVVLH